MLDGQVLAFVAVAVVLTLTPGPDMALVLRNGLRAADPPRYGRSRSLLLAGLFVAIGLPSTGARRAWRNTG